MITGRKIVEGAIVEGMFGLLKRQCRKIALKTRKCHANGTFLRFARTKSVAIIREVLPGPVNEFRRTFRMLIREAVMLRASAAVKAIDRRGRRAPEAMIKE